MRLTALAALLTFLLDQASKYWVVHSLRLDRKHQIDVLDPWFQLRMAWNQGVNFGLFADDGHVTRWVLIALALAISLWVGLWLRRHPQPPLAMAAGGLLIGGALGNVVDRILYGAVADFLNFGFPGFSNPYSFNVADIAIFAGALGLAVFAREAPPDDPRLPPGSPRNPRDARRKLR